MNNSLATLDIESNGYFLSAIVIGLSSLAGIVLYSLVVAAIIKNRQKYTKRNSYFLFLLSLATSDLLCLIGYAFYFTPCSIFRLHIFGDSADFIIIAVLNAAYYATVACIVFIGINRYWAVFKIASYEAVFDSSNAWKYIAVCWSFGFLVVSPNFFSCCRFHYDLDYNTAMYDMSLPSVPYLLWFDRIITIVSVLCLLGSYGTILIKRPVTDSRSTLGQSRTQAQRERRAKVERNLALQFLIVVISLFCLQFAYIALPYIVDSTLFFTLVYIVFFSCNPIIYLIFNSSIRADFKQLFKFQQNIVEPTTTNFRY